MNEVQATLFDRETRHATNHLLAMLEVLQQVNRGANRCPTKDAAELELINMIDGMQRIGTGARSKPVRPVKCMRTYCAGNPCLSPDNCGL
jgi:hypothetical protein